MLHLTATFLVMSKLTNPSGSTRRQKTKPPRDNQRSPKSRFSSGFFLAGGHYGQSKQDPRSPKFSPNKRRLGKSTLVDLARVDLPSSTINRSQAWHCFSNSPFPRAQFPPPPHFYLKCSGTSSTQDPPNPKRENPKTSPRKSLCSCS